MDVPVEQRAGEKLHLICRLSTLLKTGLDKRSIVILLELCETGSNPEALAEVVKYVRQVCDKQGISGLLN